MLINILTHLPSWVYAILALLVFLGWRQSRTRAVAPALTTGIAAGMLGLSVYGVIGNFGAQALPLLAWAAGFALTAVLGRELVGPRALQREGSKVRVPGSWLPFAMMMVIFSAKVALGAAVAMHAAVLHQAAFIAAMCFGFGLASGVFAARAIVVHAFARDSRPVPVRLGTA